MTFVAKSKFNAVGRAGEIRDLAQAREVINKLVDALNRTHESLNGELLNLERSVGGSGTTVINVGSGGSGGSSGSGVTVVDHRAQSYSLNAGTTPQFVPFSSAMTTAFILWWRTSNSAGESIGVQILESNITATGFTVTDCLEACTIYYGALPLA